MKAEFEEKQYEQHLNFELLQGSNVLFPPGQVLEETLGFDAAIFTKNRDLWDLFPYYFLPTAHKSLPAGIKLPTDIWLHLQEKIENIFPKFKFNVFVQHKRPEYMKRSDASEWSSWGTKYYRYKLVKHQQEALSKLDSVTDRNALVVYACPAFYTARELWDTVSSQKVIIKTNFCEASLLDGHSAYSFKRSGNQGKAHSEPKDITSKDFLSQIHSMQVEYQGESNFLHLNSLAAAIDSVMSIDEEWMSQYKRITRYMAEDIVDIPIATALIKIDAFRFITNTEVFLGY